VVFSGTIQSLLGFSIADFGFNAYIPAVLGTAVFAYGGMVFLKSGLTELKTRQPGMMALISLALIVAFGYSLFLTVAQLAGLHIHAMDFWWELAALVTIMLLGHWIEMTSIMRAQNAMGELAKLLPSTAEKLTGRKFVTVELSQLQVGDVVLVRPGGSIPADGVIVRGEASINESMVTGESRPVSKTKQDAVLAGTVLATALDSPEGAIRVEVTAIGGQTALSRIMRMVSQAQDSKSKTQTLADRTAGWLFHAALGSALVTALAWTLIGTQDVNFILERVVTVLVIACPHALGLAIPMVNWVASLRAAKAGILLRNKLDFEAAGKVDVVLFDKTGTLTVGDLAVENVRANDGSEAATNRIVALAAGLELESEHPIGRAIIAEAKRRRIKPAHLTDLMSTPGVGVSGRDKGERIFAGGPSLLLKQKMQVTAADLQFAATQAEAGLGIVYVVVENSLIGMIAIGDSLRVNAPGAIQQLQRMRRKVGIVSGDVHELVESIAKRLKVDEFFAEVLPKQKIEIVQQYQAKGLKVAMIGDGVNDAPALAQADVGIAVGDGTDVAAESAGILLVSGDPVAVPELIRLSRRARIKMVQNLWWAAGYNLLAIPLAAGVAMPIGLVLSPALGAILMSLSTIIVAANAQLLRR
jgi:Cu2+-exporting ATPase